MANFPEGQGNLAHGQLAEPIDEVQQNTAVTIAPTLQQMQESLDALNSSQQLLVQQLQELQQSRQVVKLEMQQQLDRVQETVTRLILGLNQVQGEVVAIIIVLVFLIML